MGKKVHFLGIGGSGASSVAAIAQSFGFEVSGCDINPNNDFTKDLGVEPLLQGHSPTHLINIDILAITPAVLSQDPNNEELQQAKRLGIEVLTWQEFMGKYLESGKSVIAVCGTHGKSTTTAMIGLILEAAGLDPTVQLGAQVKEWGSNFRIGKSEYFVTEADEFNNNFLVSHPKITVITSVEMDHPEYFADLQSLQESFIKFLSQTSGHIIANISNKGVGEVVQSLNRRFPESTDKISDYSQTPIDFPLKIPGWFNITNASAGYQVGKTLGIDQEVMKKTLANFTGVSRRFELLGEYKGALVYTDFAHHPTEILLTLRAAREIYPDNKIWVIFQPHMFSRTYALLNDFIEVFRKVPVDQTYITDIYASRETDTGLINSRQLVEGIGKQNISYQSKDGLITNLQNQVKPNDVIFFIGAGDIDQIANQFIGS